MGKVSEDTLYCLRHGWIQCVESAEVVSGVFVPICHMCAEAKR